MPVERNGVNLSICHSFSHCHYIGGSGDVLFSRFSGTSATVRPDPKSRIIFSTVGASCVDGAKTKWKHQRPPVQSKLTKMPLNAGLNEHSKEETAPQHHSALLPCD